MQLKKLRVENFKCIEDSTAFQIDQVTCLLGKNEAGKSAILQALEKLNPIGGRSGQFTDTEYPRRHISTARERDEVRHKNVLDTSWILDEEDVEAVTDELGIDPFASREITISKGYSNTRKWDLNLDERGVLDHVLGEARLDASSKARLGNPATIAELRETLDGLEDTNDKLNGLAENLAGRYSHGSLVAEVRALLKERLPRFLYFADYHKLPGRVAISELVRLQEEDALEFEHRIFIALLALANTSAEDVNEIGRSEELIMELEAISNRISEEIFEYWSQNRHLDVEFRFDAARPEDPPPFNEGWVFSTRIRNNRHRVTVNFDERSTGFIWFFSFLVWFSQVRRHYGDNVILLLDEPGLSLHGTAQKDLLRYFTERLRPYYQLIYTTHSPFMLDAEHIFSVRTVEDVVREHPDQPDRPVIEGTKVGQRVLSRDKDTLLPLQGIAGFDIAQSLFLGPYVLVVEGPSEAAYINWFRHALDRLKRGSLDARWAVCPAESASKVSSFVTLFSGRGLEIVALMDFHDGQKKSVRELEDSGLLSEGNLIKTTDIVAQEEADIEDLVGRPLMRHLFNACLQLHDRDQLPEQKPDDAPLRVVKELDAFARTLPPRYPAFDHFKPVRHLLDVEVNEALELPGLEQALDNFERLFERINGTVHG